MTNGARIYSISEIKKMLKEPTVEFSLYYERAPKAVQRILTVWNSGMQIAIHKVEDNDGKETAQYVWDDYKNEENDLIDSHNDVINETSAFDELSDINADRGAYADTCESFEKLKTEHDEDDMTNMYADKDFCNRVDVDIVYMTVYSGGRCPVHNSNLQKITVALIGDDNKKYGFNAKCCRECKRLFHPTHGLDSILYFLESKNIRYKIDSLEAEYEGKAFL